MRSLLKSAIAVVLFGSSLSVTMAATLEEQVKSLSEKGWQVGVSILDMENKRISINGDKRFPLDSTVKALACAHVLAQVDAKKLTLDHSKTIRQKDLVTYSPVVKDYVNKKLTIKQACEIQRHIVIIRLRTLLLRLAGGLRVSLHLCVPLVMRLRDPIDMSQIWLLIQKVIFEIQRVPML